MKLINKVKISLFISFFIILLLNVKAFAVTGVVTEITVNVREKATTNSKRIMYVTQDDKVDVLEKEGDWYKIKYKNKTGYVLGKYIKVDESKLTSKEEEPSQEEIEVKNEEPEVEASTDVEKKLKIEKNTQIKMIPHIVSSVIYTAKEDTTVNIIEQINGWTYISTNACVGWVRTDKIIEENVVISDNQDSSTSNTESQSKDNEENEQQAEKKIAYIRYDTVNLREKTSTSSKSLAKLKLNDEVTVLEKVNNVWSKVKYEDLTGYVSTELLSDKKQTTEQTNSTTTSRDGGSTSREESKEKETTTQKESSSEKENVTDNKGNTEKNETKEIEENTSSSQSKGTEIVEYAKKYLGYKYVSGGASPSTGFDCSGFTYYVYKHFGYTLSRSSVGQAKNGTKVDKKDLQPGDLVIYKNTALTRIGHVGIYIGNNQMIHASEPGVGVIITDIDSSTHNYPKRYVMSRRIIK